MNNKQRVLSKNKLKKEIYRIQELREDHETRYFMGYEDALRWVAQRIELQVAGACKIPVKDCMGGQCMEHYKCKGCGKRHTRE